VGNATAVRTPPSPSAGATRAAERSCDWGPIPSAQCSISSSRRAWHGAVAPSALVAVSAEVGNLSRIPSVAGEERHWFVTGWQDVENWASAIITFDDGSRAVVYASDAVLGGMESRLEIFASNCRLKCNLSPNSLLQTYAPAPEVFGDEYLQEKLETKAGWTTPMPDEDWTSGHLAMCQAFIEAVAEGRPAKSDGLLGLEVTRVIYAAYCAAAEGRRVEIA